MNDSAAKRQEPALSLKRLDRLEWLVATKMTSPDEWATFIALLRRAGFDTSPDGVQYVG